MSYCDVEDVLNATGLDIDRIIKLSPRHADDAAVRALIQEFIDDAQKEIEERMKINVTINKELHLCTGEDDVYELGPEDEPESFVEYNVLGNLIEAFNLYLGGNCPKFRRLRPYPTDCELGTESDASHWETNCGTIVAISTTRKAGSYSIQLTYVTGAEYQRYPKTLSDEWIDKNIDIYEFMAFYVRSTVANTKVTVRLYNAAGDYNEANYTIVKKNHWYLVMFDLEEDFTDTVDWDDDPLMYVEFHVDVACVLLVDNMNFNDYWMFTAPAGEIAIMRNLDEEPKGQGYPFYVSYSFDPYLTEAPRNIKKACACLAGVDLIDFMRGIRMEDVEFDAQAESGVIAPARDQFTITRNSLLQKYEEALEATGLGFDFSPIDV